MKTLATALAALAAVGCAHEVRFADAPVVWRVEDTADIEAPEDNEYYRYAYMADVFLLRRTTRALELPNREAAQDTNALDAVPDSTWFENRIGRRPMSPEEAAQGPSVRGPPVMPLTVTSGKSAGGNPGFFAKDARGVGYLIKFDTLENPEMQTATDAIVSRILWAAGYHVPADHVFVFHPRDLSIGDGAKLKGKLGTKRPMTGSDLQDILQKVPQRPDGRYRALASTLLPGRPLGGAVPEGTRPDDPNDVVPHEHRRGLRGLRAIAAWLNHTDMKEDNTLDMYVEEGGRRFVRHYLVDFGEAMAAHAAEKGRPEDGYEHFWDWQKQPLALFAFGLWVRPWERLEETRWLSVGAFQAEPFDPIAWREAYPYWPFMRADAADLYWGARLVMSFDRPVLEAIVGTAAYSHPAAARHVVGVLRARQRAIGEAYLEAVTPLDDFTVVGGALCGVDQSVRFGIASGGTVEVLDDRDRAVSHHGVGLDGTVCLPMVGDEAYRVLRVRTRRGQRVHPPMQLHMKGWRLLGVVRIEH